MSEFDFVIVGAGSAGCVLADKLSRDGRYAVAVLEAGGSDANPWIKLPIGYGRTFFDERVNWKFETEPDPACDGRRGYWPRGRVVGGSSSINALVYVRGLPSDYDDWQAAGAVGWSWEDVRPHFEKIERKSATDGGMSGNGPLWVTDVADRIHPANQYFFTGAVELGLPRTQDFNGDEPEGVGSYWITTRNGMRCSAADAFLKPALKRPNLNLLTDCRATRIVFRDGRATGVVCRHGGVSREISARADVIVSAGAVCSPKLLQLSGIGPGQLLRDNGIEIAVDNPHVGGNLQDHMAVTYYYKASEPTLNNQLSPWWGKVWAGLRYGLTRRGPLGLSINQCGGFVRSRPGLSRPDIQLYFAPVTYKTELGGKRPIITPDPFPGFLISFQPARPTSRGRIDIRSANECDPPRITTNLLSTNKDLEDVVAGGKLLQSLVRTQGIRQLMKEPIPPDLESLDPEGLIEDFRKRCSTVFHPVSTCRMNADETEGVVNTDLKVHGVAGLRVVDASVFPHVTSGNTNAPTLMVAHKAAEQILTDPG